MEQMLFSRWFLKRLLGMTLATALFACLLSLVLTRTTASDSVSASPAWSRPGAMSVRRVSSVTTSQTTPVLLNNLDCSLITYRLSGKSTMQTGCFTETAFGFMDSDSYTVIFTGTDEGLTMTPYTSRQILVPWPKAMDLIALEPVSTGGTFLNVYRNPLSVFQDQRNTLGQLTAKRLVAPPDLQLKDPSGKPLIINPQTIAFSDGGSWLVTETFSRSFVRINLATLSVTAFAPAYGAQGGPALLQSRVSISENGRFIAIENNAAVEFKVYDLSTCDGKVDNLRPQTCQYYDYYPFVRQQISGLRSIRRVRLINDGLLSFEAVTLDPAYGGVYELAPTVYIHSLTDYLGLGDSYSSGEGAFDYMAGTDTPDNMCHLSRRSYTLLLAHDLFGNGGHSIACSGASINDIGSASDTYRGQVRGIADWRSLQASHPQLLESVEANFMPGYIAQHRLVKRWQPGIVTVLIGGNDIGFGDILQKCVAPHVGLRRVSATCYSTYEDRVELERLIDRTVPRWMALYSQLKREVPDMRLYVLGYPQVAVANGSCALNVQLNKSELSFAEQTINYLNDHIRSAALASGVPYIDIAQALKGRRLCETASYNIAVNGLTAGTDAGFGNIRMLGKESYHPNALGHELIEQAILRQTHNLADAPNVTSPPTSSPDFLNVPKSGRTVYSVTPVTDLSESTGKRGLALAVHANGASSGLRAGSTYSVRLDGPQGTLLATAMSDSLGNVNASVVIPDSAWPGSHTLDLVGVNQAGEPTDLIQSLYIPASDADSDGDGIENSLDTCPGVPNSKQDMDRDNVDDLCDPLIGLPGAISSFLHRSTGNNSGGESSRGQHIDIATGRPRSRYAVLATTSEKQPKPIRSEVPYRRGKDSALWGLIVAIVPCLGLLAVKIYIKSRQHRLQ